MRKTSHLLKPLLILFVFGAALSGCERRAADDAGTQSSGSQSMSSGSESSGASRPGSAAESGSTAQRAGRAIDDSVITTKAKSALLADTTVKGTEINVDTNKGVVTLSGTADTDQQRERAASIVRGIDGVKSVENKVTLKK